MAWRPMRSLAETPSSQTTGLRGQVNAAAPSRSKASDGLVGNAAHETTSGHYPHPVAGVGDEMVTAWDCTNDPAHGCDSRKLAEALRVNRDKRIRYVISRSQVFSSYSSGSRAAWTWGPYTGSDPHENHAHIQVLDAPISDTTTPWNLEGFAMTDPMWNVEYTAGFFAQAIAELHKEIVIPPAGADKVVGGYPGYRSVSALEQALARIEKAQADAVIQAAKDRTALDAVASNVQVIMDKLNAGGGGGTVVLPTSVTIADGAVTWQ